MQHGILQLNDSTLEQLKQKHPQGVDPAKDILLPDEPEVIHPIKFESINSELIRKVAIKGVEQDHQVWMQMAGNE